MSTTRESIRRSNADVARAMRIAGSVLLAIGLSLVIVDTPLADIILENSAMTSYFGISTWLILVNLLLGIGALLVICSVVVRRLPELPDLPAAAAEPSLPPGAVALRRRSNNEVARTMLVIGVVVLGMSLASHVLSESMYEVVYFLPFGVGNVITRTLGVLTGVGYPLGSFLVVGSIIVRRIPEPSPTPPPYAT